MQRCQRPEDHGLDAGAVFFLQIVPFLGLTGVAGFWSLRILIPAMVIRWWIRFGSISTDDPDFARAKKIAIVISIVALLGLLSAIPLHARA